MSNGSLILLVTSKWKKLTFFWLFNIIVREKHGFRISSSWGPCYLRESWMYETSDRINSTELPPLYRERTTPYCLCHAEKIALCGIKRVWRISVFSESRGLTYLELFVSGTPSADFPLSFCTSLALDLLMEARSFEKEPLLFNLPLCKQNLSNARRRALNGTCTLLYLSKHEDKSY